MSTAAEEKKGIIDGTGILAKVAPDEPIFVLRAQDRLSPFVVSVWIWLAWWFGVPEEKVFKAMNCRDAMKRWPTRRRPN
jgi:hypothetical protein